MEEDLKISKLNISAPTDYLSSGDQTKIKNVWNKEDLPWKTTSKYLKLNILASTDQNYLKF